MSASEDLAEIIRQGMVIAEEWGMDHRDIAADIAAAGFHRDRTITTAEELDALPDMAIIRDCLGNVLEAAVHDQDGLIEWWATGSADDYYSVSLPAIVLWEPGDDDE